ncbi:MULTISPECIES: hypothetical protein [unclassified Bradyrhizobium]|uniref:hypothetical protein n=1 Tax=unclassified Bradyrhizobium TaxID=2631580 RepID=UPI00247A1167|nr:MULTISPECIES: hypothetical protein [unclassified Bradyrhizobium]WGR68007.1 hypothetical protein MTX24_21360 [Bradyrhizobium sp. ISRA426]WGR80061.1 hypothetical protein MTX21_06475 [Bradyrhizobium sp. ISRA430]WGR83246.1 hypothetical protein MTX25_21040 [Bradyrhizobium sp. ISRA432]
MPKPEPGEKPKPQAGKARSNPPPNPQSGDSRRAALAGLIIAAVILGVGLWLARDLTAASKMQDCLMSGRTNCNVIEPAR